MTTTKPFAIRSLPRLATVRGAAASLLAAGLLLSPLACSRQPRAQAPKTAVRGEAQQAIVEDSAAALIRMRDSSRFAAMEDTLRRSRAVLIFPHVVKASVLFGGEGGNGVMVARAPDGSWSDPAFYSLGAPSVGLQVGYQRASIVVFIMDQATLDRALYGNLTIGSSAGATLGAVGDHDRTVGAVTAPSVVSIVEAGGAYAGVSLDGYVVGPRAKHNLAYYGVAETPTEILIERRVRRADAHVLSDALRKAL
jgi:lipid-binding SYLF domain-containing protein